MTIQPHFPKKTHLGLIEVDSVKIGARLRETNIGGVHALKSSFGVIGQLAPIIVDIHNGLLAGAHRLQAAKELQWQHIDAIQLDVRHYSPEMAVIVTKLVEVDENLQRSDLSEAQRVKFMGKRVEYTEERIAREKFEKEEALSKQAAKERADALAAIKKAKDAADKARLQAEFDRKEQDRKNADDRRRTAERSAGRLSVATDKNPAPGKTVIGVTKAVATELGLKEHRVRDLISFRNQVGDDVIDLFEGTKLATQSELRGFIELKKQFPERAAKLVELNTRLKASGKLTTMYSPCRELGILVKEKNERERTLRMGTDEGKLEDLRSAAMDVMNALTKLRGVVARQLPDNRAKLGDVSGLVESFNKVHQRINAMTKPPQQKRTGTEHRYGGSKEGPSRVDAAKELEAHDAEIKAIVAKKAKKEKPNAK